MNYQAPTSLHITLPDWVNASVNWQHVYQTDAEKMALAIHLSQLNIAHGTGGPFGAAIYDASTGHLLSIGVNRVMANNNSVLHAEIMAIMFAEQRLRSFTLAATEKRYELFCSCEPCAMCLGAVLWSGIKRLTCAASGNDARAIGFDEGPVFTQSFDYLQEKGVDVVRGMARLQAQAILQDYARQKGPVYNP